MSDTLFNPDAAYPTFKARYLENKDKKKIDNASLYAGSPMYYYCRGCEGLAATLPEGWFRTPPPKYCEPCKAIAQHGLLTEFRQRAEKEATEA